MFCFFNVRSSEGLIWQELSLMPWQSPSVNLPAVNRVLKRLRHVAMALKNSVPNKLAFWSKWPRYLSHRCFLSSLTKRNRLKREKITFTLIMWKHFVTSKEFYEEKSTQVWKRRFIKSRWVNVTIYQLRKHTVLFWSENVVVFSSNGLGRNFPMFSKDTMFVDCK